MGDTWRIAAASSVVRSLSRIDAIGSLFVLVVDVSDVLRDQNDRRCKADTVARRLSLKANGIGNRAGELRYGSSFVRRNPIGAEVVIGSDQ